MTNISNKLREGAIEYEATDVVAVRVAENICLGFYLNSCVIGLALAGCKLGGAVGAGWQWVLMPFYLPPLIMALMFFGIAENAMRRRRP